MNQINARKDIANQVLEGRFVRQVLHQTSQDIEQAQTREMSSRGFSNNDWFQNRSFQISEDTMGFLHLKKHRFVDMKNRNTKNGSVKKKFHPIHNRIIYGHYNNIIKELHFGFTEAVKNELKKIDN